MNPAPSTWSDETYTAEMRRALRELPDAPPALLQAALALWPSQVAAPASAPALAELAQAALRLVQAVLTFDSWHGSPVAAGMRGLRSPTRHLLFSAEGRDADLRITAADDRFALTGQILGPDEAGAVELQFLDGDEAAASRATTLDSLGEFRLEGLEAGQYVLTLHLGDARIVLPPVQVGGPGGAAAA